MFSLSALRDLWSGLDFGERGLSSISSKGDGTLAFFLIGRNSSIKTQVWLPPQKIR